ncbi:titin homolog [Pomacea canaliculata]|uniref:titin homolog n=1 Tax=Pomacea canaliculata TaxID=400727 RepID=UPI000D733152|nr:titin homolog [Pomacea canaliculata]
MKDEQISSHFIAGEIKEQVTLPFIAAQSKEEEQQITAHFIADETKEEQNMFLPFIADEVKQDSEIITLPLVSIDTKKDQNTDFLLVSGESKKQQGPTFTLPFIAGETKVEELEAALPSITGEIEKAGAMGTLPFIAVETRETFALPFVVDDHQKEEPMVTLPSVAMETEKEEHKVSLPLVVDEPKQEGPRITLPFITIDTKGEKQKISLPSGYIAMETKAEEQKVPLSFVAKETEKGHQKISLPSVAREPRQEEPMITLPFIDMDTKEDEQQISFSLVATETKDEKQKISLPFVVDEPKQEGPRVTLPFITMETKEDEKISLPFAGGEHKQEEPKVSLPFVAMETKEEERKISLPFVAIETEKEEQRISLPLVACEAKQEGPRVALPSITTETKQEKQISLPSGYIAMETKQEKQISLPSGYIAMETKEEQKISLPSVAGETNQEEAKTMLCDVTCEAKQKVKQVTVITVEKTHLPQRLDVLEEKREVHKSEADIVPHTATTSQKELVDTSLRTEVSPMKFHVQVDTPGQTTELQEVQENILPQATVGLHGSHPEIGPQKMKEHVGETTETTPTPLSPAQLRAREKEMKALKKKEEKARAKAAKDEKKRLKEEKKREAKEKKTKEKGKLTEIEVTVKIIEEPKTEVDDELIVPLTAAEESTRFRSSAIFSKPNEVAQETFTVAQTVKSSHAPPSDFKEEPTEPIEEPLTVAQTVKLEAVHVSPAIVAELGSPQGEVTRQTEVVIGPNSAVQEGDKVVSLGFHGDDIISSIESSVIKVDESLQTKRKDEKPDGRPPDLPESPYPDDDTLETPKVDQVRDIPNDSLSDVSESLSASWGETDWTPYIRLSPRTKEAVRSPETGEASGSPLKKIELGPRLRTAILRRITGEVRMSEVKRVNLTKPRSVDTLATTPPSRRQRPRRPGEPVSSADNRDNSSLSIRSSCGASIQYHPASLSPACEAVDGQEETRETLPTMPLEQLATSEDEERSGEQKSGSGSERRRSTTSDGDDIVGSDAGDLLSGELFVSTLQVVVTSSQEVDGEWRPTSGQEGDLDLIEGAEDTAEGGDTYREVYVVEGRSLGLSSVSPQIVTRGMMQMTLTLFLQMRRVHKSPAVRCARRMWNHFST